jgi:serine/threonine protein kinase
MNNVPLEQLGPYRLIQPIEQGECGAVYRARNTMLNRDVAIKIVKLGERNLSNANAMRRLFMNEAKLAATLRHPNIVTIYDTVENFDVAFIVMESIYNGRSLHRHCKCEDDHLSIPEAIEIAAKCAYGLHHAHEQGVVHRDIKPRNILLDRGNEPRIVDFGLAVAMRTDATMAYLLGAGTPLYMAPEQVMEETGSPQTDLFSLTVVLYELFTGRHPFAGKSLSEILTNVMKREAQPLSRLRADVPRPLEKIVTRGLSKQRANRYSTARDFAADLELVLDMYRESRSATRVRRKTEIARSLKFFSAFAAEEIREVTAQAAVQRFDKGQTLIAEGDVSSAFFFVLQGTVLVRHGRTSVALLKRGECVGEMAALTGRPRTASVVAPEPTISMMVPGQVLNETRPACRLKLQRCVRNAPRRTRGEHAQTFEHGTKQADGSG